MDEFRECMEGCGVDYDGIMKRFKGNETIYMRFLNMLPQDDNLEKLGTALKEERYGDAFEAAHTLKGVAGNLGLTPLYDALCEIVEPLRAGEVRDFCPLYDKICDKYKQMEEMRAKLEAL